MPTTAPPSLDVAEVAVWAGPERAELAGDVVDRMAGAARPLAVGGPACEAVADLGRRLGCPVEHDLRKLLNDRPVASVLVAEFDGIDPLILGKRLPAGTRALCLEPRAAGLHESPPGYETVASAPRFLDAPGHHRAAEPLDALPPPRLIRFSSLGRPTHGSLLARALDAWAAVLAYADLPETVTASAHDPTGEPDPPIRRRRGWLAAHARLADGGAVLVEAADTAAHTRRQLSVLTADAQLTVSDTGYKLRQNNGAVLDAGDDDRDAAGFADLIADQWRRDLERPVSATRPEADAAALACVHAALLSARTGEPESPRQLLKMQG
ncbi:MAG: hypothetical protein AAF800_11635 [Planctomycetota bacterium]